MTVTAAVFDGPGRPLRRVLFPRPALGPGEALVRIRLCTLCGSDLHTFFGRRTEPTPAVLGHELVGEVEELGPGDLPRDLDGEPLRVGDRVVWSVAVSCGGCFFCTHDLPQKCETLVKYGKVKVDGDRGLFGGLATHCHLLPGTAAVKVPPGLPDEVAAPAMCAAATAVAALRAAGNPGGGGCLLVTGLGLLGLTACAAASSAGLTVIGLDREKSRLMRAAGFGFGPNTFHFPDGLPELIDFLDTHTPGRGADLAIETTGAADPTDELLHVLLRTGGALVLVGAVMPTPPLPVRPEHVVRHCLTIRGVHNYHPRDLRTAVRWLADHHARFPFADLVARTFPLAEAEEAFHFAERERPIRVAVRP